jgi:hypothetical protein
MKINSKTTISSRMKLKKNQSKEIKLEDEIFFKIKN